MVDLVKYLIDQLVDQPDIVTVTDSADDTGLITILVTVDPEDMGKVIGKGGKIISAIRELVKVKAIKLGKRVKLILTEPQTDQPSPLEPPAESPQKS